VLDYIVSEGIKFVLSSVFWEQAANSPLPQDIAEEEIKVFIVLILQIGHDHRTTLKSYYRGDQLDQLWEPHFGRQQLARAMYSMLTCIISKYHTVLTDHLTELV
jgi:hypothetical protein